jgi:predicted NBD/HSP70 family sugar kinase
MPLHIAVDLGGTTGRVESVEHFDDTTCCGRRTFQMQKTHKDMSSDELLSAFWADYSNLIEKIRDSANDEVIASISVLLPGNIDDLRQMILGAGNTIHWSGRPIVKLLTNEFWCPVYLGNDAEGLVLAELYFGEADGMDALGVVIGTGIGGAFVKHVGPKRKPHIFPTELGHMRHFGLDSGNVKACGCGHKNCLEAFAGGRSIELRDGDPAELPRARWAYYYSNYFGLLYNVAVVVKPKVIVLGGGGACKQQEWLLPYLHHRFNSELTIVQMPEVIKISGFGESAGTRGAKALGKLMHKPSNSKV